MPTGIDRVCLAYATHYRASAQAVIQRGSLRRVLSPSASAAMFTLLLDGGPRFRADFIRLLGCSLGQFGRQSLAERLYLNVGHTGLERPGVRDWVRQSRARAVYMVHDLIPLTHPEYCRSGEAERHAARMTTMVTTGAGIIANSQATLDELSNWADARALAMPPARVAWLGTQPLPRGDLPAPVAGSYFVTLGTIEGRKNHLMLLNLWRTLAERLGAATPKLVVIGQRGWAAAPALALLDGCDALRGHVIELAGCDDTTLARYLANARALLFPSFAEGYGLPLTEALACGTPVVASDLAVFRELAGDIPRYLDPLDNAGWRKAVLELTGGGGRHEHRRLAATRYRAPDWAAHFAQVDEWLDALFRQPRLVQP